MNEKRKQAEEIRDAGTPDDAAVEPGLPTQAESEAAGEQSGSDKDLFSRERLLGSEAERITGYPAHVVRGALLGDDDTAAFERADIQKRIKTFLTHEDTTGSEQEA